MDDRSVVEVQIGRPPRSEVVVSARCHLALPVVIEQLFIGLVVGNGVGFGMELADLGQVGGASAFADRRGDPD